MSNERLQNKPKPVTRFILASREAFADWTKPTVAELNANLTNDPSGLIWNLTCAIAQENTTHDLADSETDEELSFCQVAGAVNPVTRNVDIQWTIFRDEKAWLVSDVTTESIANLAFSLLAWRGVEYFAIASVGKAFDQPFAVGDKLKMASVATDYLADEVAAGETVKGTQSFAQRGDVNWNYTVAS